MKLTNFVLVASATACINPLDIIQGLLGGNDEVSARMMNLFEQGKKLCLACLKLSK